MLFLYTATYMFTAARAYGCIYIVLLYLYTATATPVHCYSLYTAARVYKLPIAEHCCLSLLKVKFVALSLPLLSTFSHDQPQASANCLSFSQLSFHYFPLLPPIYLPSSPFPFNLSFLFFLPNFLNFFPCLFVCL